jgi:hypothetical protein
VAAVAAGASATILHVLVTNVTLAGFDPFCSARPLGEALGRAADGGASLLAFGFENREQLSPFMFYARRPLVELARPRELEAALRGRACALVPAGEYARFRDTLRDLPHRDERIGALRLVVVSGAAGCPAVESR